MGHSYSSSLYHVVYSTRERRKQIDSELAPRLWPYLGGVARENGFHAIEVGGIADHVHLLLSLPAKLSIAKAIQILKGVSSRWVHVEFPSRNDFAWQEGYGAFSIGISQIVLTRAYIQNQEEHHRTKSFQEEFLGFLKKHNVDFDPEYVWG
jgi:REP element-mobilizing transposase RayT